MPPAFKKRIAQLVAIWLGTGEVPGSNSGKGENFSVKISNWMLCILTSFWVLRAPKSCLKPLFLLKVQIMFKGTRLTGFTD